MSNLLKKFTTDSTDTRPVRREDDFSAMQRPREFVSQPPTLTRTLDANRTNLCSDVELKGSLIFKEYLRLDGKFEGEVRSQGTFLVGENGVVRADIQVGNLIVEGKIYGNVVAQDKIELRATAQLFGDIKAARLVINEGVVFVGKSDVNPAEKVESIPQPPIKEQEPMGAAEEPTPTLRDSLY